MPLAIPPSRVAHTLAALAVSMPGAIGEVRAVQGLVARAVSAVEGS